MFLLCSVPNINLRVIEVLSIDLVDKQKALLTKFAEYRLAVR